MKIKSEIIVTLTSEEVRAALYDYVASKCNLKNESRTKGIAQTVVTPSIKPTTVTVFGDVTEIDDSCGYGE